MSRTAVALQPSEARVRQGEVDTEPLLDVTRPAGRPIRVGIVSNPKSGRNARRGFLKRVRRMLREHPTVPGIEADSLDSILAGTRELIDRGVELLVLNGGDGTVSAALTALFREPVPARLPVVAVLPGGTTNSTARAVGYAKNPDAGLRQILAGAAAGQMKAVVMPHPVLRVAIDDQVDPVYAMFLGAGAVFHGIQFYKRQIEARGFRGELGATMALSAVIFNVATGRTRKFFPPLEMRGHADGTPLADEPYFGVLVSTMEGQFSGIRPYWGTGPGPIRCSTLRYEPRHLLGGLPTMLTGKPTRYATPENGFRSFNAFEMELDMDSGFTLDGELFEPPGRVRLNVTARQKALFLRRPRS